MKEKYEIINKKIKINPLGDEFCDVETVRIQNYIYKVYESDLLGMYECKKTIPDEVGYTNAARNLKIPYPYKPSSNVQINVIANRQKYNISTLSKVVSNIYNEAKKIDDSIQLTYTRDEYSHNLTNDLSLHLNYENTVHNFHIQVKSNVIEMSYHDLDENIVKEDLLPQLVAIKNYYDGSNAKYSESSNNFLDKFQYFIIPTCNQNIYDYFEKILHPSTFFKKNIGDNQIFSSNLNLYTSLNFKDKSSNKYKNLPFFDFEGSYNQYYRKVLIRDGVPIRPYSDKSLEKNCTIENTACSYLDKDFNLDCKLLGAYIDSPVLDFDKKSALYLPDCLVSFDGQTVNMKSGYGFFYTEDGNLSKIENISFKTDSNTLFCSNFVGVTDKYNLSGGLSDGLVFKF